MPFPNPFDLQHHRFGSGEGLVEQFLSTYGSRKTRRNYRTDLRQFFGEEKVTRQMASQVKEGNVAEFLQERADSLKRATLKRKLEAIRSFFRWIAEQNMIDDLPIKEELDTGDLIDQVLQEARKTTEGEEDSRRMEEPEGKDEIGSGGSRRGPLPMELEPGSELNVGRETDSSLEKSSSPESRPEGGASEVSAGAEGAPDSEHTESPLSESPLSEAAPREELRSGESSGDRSTGSDSDSAGEGPPKEKSVEDRDTRDKPVGEQATEENSANEDSSAEDSTGKGSTREGSRREDGPGLPGWAVPSGNTQKIDLDRGEHVALADLPDALVGALPELEEPGGPEGLFIRCSSDLKVAIRPRRDEDPQIIETSIEHYVLHRLLRGEEDLSEEHVLRQAIIYLHDLNWTLPRRAYDLVGALPSPSDAEGPFSEERPRWRLEGTDDGLGHPVLAALITGVLAEGFGTGKDEEVFVGI